MLPAAAGDEADADLDEARVRLGRGLHRGAREAELEPAAERHAVRRGDDRHARVLHALQRVLEASSPSRGCCPTVLAASPPSTTRKRFAPTQKCSPWLAMTIARKSRLGAARSRRAEHRDDVGVEAVRLGLEGEAEHAVAEVPRLRAVVLEDGRVALAEDRRASRCAGRSALSTYLPASEVEDLAVLVEARSRRAARIFSIDAGSATPSFFIRSTVSAKPSASHVSKGPSSQL